MNFKKRLFLTASLWLLMFFGLALTGALAQQTQPKPALPTNVENHQLNSKLMAREMPYRVVLPENYKKVGDKTAYPVIYLLHGLTGHFDNWSDRPQLAEYATQYNYIFVTPEGGNGWYSDSASVPNDRYESYIVQELMPEVEKKFRVQTARNQQAIAGLSMGGYGALKFGLKYPDKFVLVGSFSGALPAASWTPKTLGNNWKALTDSITSVYGAEGSPTRQANDIFRIVRETPAENVKNLPFVYLDCGTEDFLIGTNREFAALLFEKKIPHEFRQLPGAHDWRYWETQIQEFLEVSEKFIKRAETK